MAYVNKEKKEKIAAALSKVIPITWKYTLSIGNHSTIVLKVYQVDHSFIADGLLQIDQLSSLKESLDSSGYFVLNRHSHFQKDDTDRSGVVSLMNDIIDAMNTDNYDNSDSMTDYFDVGHYVDIRFGLYNQPLKVLSPEETEAVVAKKTKKEARSSPITRAISKATEGASAIQAKSLLNFVGSSSQTVQIIDLSW